jgi:nitrogen fixation-related uncharacterized protein
MQTAFQIAIPVTMGLVFVILLFGIYTLFRSGDFGRSWSNRMMRLRVVVQFAAVLVLLGALWWSQHMAKG